MPWRASGWREGEEGAQFGIGEALYDCSHTIPPALAILTILGLSPYEATSLAD